MTRSPGTRPLAEALPPVTGEVLGSWELAVTADLRVLRTGLHQALHAQRARSGAVVLVGSELATNALRHGAPPVVVTLLRSRSAYVLDVADGAADERPVLAGRRPLGEGGIGLYLVGRMADEVGWHADGDRKHVWAVFTR